MARTRSRKRRPTGARPARENTPEQAVAGAVDGTATPPASAQDADARRERRRQDRNRRDQRRSGAAEDRRRSPAAPRYGERPRSPWHPLPISELLILVGAVSIVLGMSKLNAQHPSISQGGTALLIGIAAVGVGSFEVALREHRSGYRSHTIMLAALPVLVFHSLVILGVSAFTAAPRLLNVGLFAVDIALFAFLFRLLRAHFLDGRHARVLRGR